MYVSVGLRERYAALEPLLSVQPHLKARTAGSKSHHFLIEGKDDLA